MSDGAERGGIPPRLQKEYYGIDAGEYEALRPLLIHGCVVCGARRRADNSGDPGVRAATSIFVAAIQSLARCSISPSDCTAVAVAWWNKQAGVSITTAEQARCIFLHMYHCNTSAWFLRILLIRFNMQATSALGYIGRHGGTKDVSEKLGDIAKGAMAAISVYRATFPGNVQDVVIHGFPDIPVRRWCVFCHSPRGIRERLYERYAEVLTSGNSGTIADIAEALADGLAEDDLACLQCTRAEVARDAHYHYLVHDASPLALIHRLTAAISAIGISSVWGAIRLEGGTLTPASNGASAARKAEIAIARLSALVARVPGTERYAGMPAQGLRFVRET